MSWTSSQHGRIYSYCWQKRQKIGFAPLTHSYSPTIGGAQGQATDIEIQAREILRIKRQLNELMAEHTGQSVKQIEKDTDRDNIMTAEEAKEYGLVDEVIVRLDQPPA